MPASSLPVTRAVRELRQTLQESQQAFAYRMKSAVRTIARYETVRPPRGSVLAQLEGVALEAGRADLATVFRQALAQELGSPSQLMTPEERAWSQAICNLLRNRDHGGPRRCARTAAGPATEGAVSTVSLGQSG